MSNTRLSWDVWNEVPHPDGMAIMDPDGFRGGKPTVVTWDEFERARMECTLLPRQEYEARMQPELVRLRHDLLWAMFAFVRLAWPKSVGELFDFFAMPELAAEYEAVRRTLK